MNRSIVVSFFLVSVLGCGPQRTLDENALAPIRIGVVVSQSGGLGGAGPGWLDASRLAVLEVNAAGGLLGGRPVELVVVDDETNTNDMDFQLGLAQQMIDAEVAGVVGSAASSISLGVASALTPARIPQISCCSTSDRITAFNEGLSQDARFFFRTIAPDRLQSQVVALAAQDLNCMRVGILHLADDYGQPFGEAIESALVAKGITVATRVPFTQGQPDYSAEVAMLAAATPDCIALVAFPESAGQIVRDWSAVGLEGVTWIGTDGIREPSFVEEVGSPGLIVNFFGTSPITDAPTPAYNDFSERFAAAFSGESPIPFASNQYDATALLLLAIERAGSTDGVAVRDALREVSTLAGGERTWRAVELAGALDDLANGRDIDYFGAAGNMDFDTLGNVVSPYEIWRYDPPDMPRTCAGARSELSGDLGSYCRSRTISAAELGS